MSLGAGLQRFIDGRLPPDVDDELRRMVRDAYMAGATNSALIFRIAEILPGDRTACERRDEAADEIEAWLCPDGKPTMH